MVTKWKTLPLFIKLNPNLKHLIMDTAKVSDFIINETNWVITSLTHNHLNKIVNKIKAIPIPLMDVSDRHVRKFTSTSESSVKTTT